MRQLLLSLFVVSLVSRNEGARRCQSDSDCEPHESCEWFQFAGHSGKYCVDLQQLAQDSQPGFSGPRSRVAFKARSCETVNDCLDGDVCLNNYCLSVDRAIFLLQTQHSIITKRPTYVIKEAVREDVEEEEREDESPRGGCGCSIL